MNWRRPYLEGLREGGLPRVGPASVHIDVTNACNAACVTCWDHSPLLAQARPAEWKRQRLSFEAFERVVGELDALGSVRHVVLSGMGEPLTHPRIYDMIAAVKARGWELTVISNLVAADVERLCASGIDQLLVGVQGVTPESYTAFHPGWTERHFFDLCRILRALSGTNTRVRHVQVIERDNASEIIEMVRFARSFRADRVNFKLAALHSGTEACAISEDQRDWLLTEGVGRARGAAAELGVRTNLDLFETQLRTGGRSTAPSSAIGCSMGYVFTRITVDLDVLFCCNVNVRVGSLRDAAFCDLWWGARWQHLRDELRAGHFFRACDQCGKLEQNARWAQHLAGAPAALDRATEPPGA